MVSIGTLSRQSGVKVPTIRYYEQVGLMPEPGRSEGGQRRYGAGHADRLGFIRHARALGFPLEAVRDLLELAERPDQTCAEANALAAERLADVRARIAQLQRLEGELERIAQACDGGRVADCRVLTALGDHGACAGEHGGAGAGVGGA